MSVALEFIDLIVPIEVIRDKYPGGWAACLRDHASLVGRRVWFDEHLFRDGATTPAEMQLRVEGWTVLGFNAHRRERGLDYWDDLCVVDLAAGGPTLRCEWLHVSPLSRTAWRADTVPGDYIDRRRVALDGRCVPIDILL